MTRALYKSDRHAALGMAFPSENPSRKLAQNFTPQPMDQPNWFQRQMRKLFRVTEPTYRAPFLNDNDMGL